MSDVVINDKNELAISYSSIDHLIFIKKIV